MTRAEDEKTMFAEMRRNTKTILWITVAAFIGLIFLAWGADFQLGSGAQRTGNEIARVNGEPISGPYYEQLVAQQRANYQQQAERVIDDRTEVMIRSQTWNSLIQEALLSQEARRRGITVTDQEIVQAVMTQPPQEVVQNPAFQTNGQFDLQKYQAALQSPNVDTRPLEEQYRRTLPLEKLQQQVLASVVVSDEELWDGFRMQNEKVRAKVLVIPVEKFTVDETGIPEAEIDRYYQGHRSLYKAPPQATIQYVSFPRMHTPEDSLDLLEQARSILRDYREGEEFSSLVEDFSEALGTLRGGERGTYQAYDDLGSPAIRGAVQGLEVGQVTEVITEPNGFHIIKLEDRKEEGGVPKVKIADIFLPLNASPETVSSIFEKAQSFRQEVERRDFAAVAAEMQYQVKETRPFIQKGFVPDLGSVPEVQEFTFSHPAGSISPPLEKPEGWMIVRVKERREERIPDLNEVIDRVRTQVADSLRQEQARQAAEPLLAQAQAGVALEDLATRFPGATVESPEPFARLRATPLGNDPRAAGPVFAAEPGLVPRVVVGRLGAFVVRVEEKIPASRELFETQKTSLRQNLLQRRQNEYFTAWLDDLKKKAQIEDYRAGIF